MLKKFNILDIANKELLSMINDCNNTKEKVAYILNNMTSETGKTLQEPEELFANTAKIAARLLVKRYYTKKGDELIRFKKPSTKTTKKTDNDEK